MRRLYSLGTFEQSISALVQMLDKLQEDVYKDVRQLASVRIKNQLGQIQIIMDFLTITTDSWSPFSRRSGSPKPHPPVVEKQ